MIEAPHVESDVDETEDSSREKTFLGLHAVLCLDAKENFVSKFWIKTEIGDDRWISLLLMGDAAREIV